MTKPLKNILISVVLGVQLVSVNSFAQKNTSYAYTEEQIQQMIAESLLEEMAEKVNRVQLGRDVAYPIGGVPVADECVAFMNKDMFLGENGKNIFASFKKHASVLPNVVHGGTLSKYCPKYPSMNLDQKGLVWVVLLTMIAHFESSCNPKASAKGPNGTAYGYYQLHLGKEGHYDSDVAQLCLKNASKNGKISNECTMAMLERQLSNQAGNLFYSKSYWDVLRPNGRAQKHDDIQRALKNSSLCSPKFL